MGIERLQYCYKYPHPAVSADCVVMGWDGVKWNLLLIERKYEPYKGKWAFPGGFMEMKETAEECARRELMEETGLDCSVMEQIGAYSDVNRDPRERVVTIAFLMKVDVTAVQGGDDASRAMWFPLDEVPPLAFDHSKILHDALNRMTY